MAPSHATAGAAWLGAGSCGMGLRGGCLCGPVVVDPRRDRHPHRHDDTEATGGVAADARAEFVAQAEGAADLPSLCSCHAGCASR